MELDLSSINWYAVALCVVFGQAFLSVWFIVLFGTPWAKEYGAADKKQHAKEIPGYTYGIQAGCTLLLTLGIAVLQTLLNTDSFTEGLTLGAFVAVFFILTTALPGYLFLKRMNAFWMAAGSQAIVVVAISIILAVWK